MENHESNDAAWAPESRHFPMRIPTRIKDEIFAERTHLKSDIVKCTLGSDQSVVLPDTNGDISLQEISIMKMASDHHNREEHTRTDGEGRIDADIAIIIVTSPSPVHPDTSMLWEVLLSVDEHMPEFGRCPIVVVCDGFKLASTFKRRNPFCSAKTGFILEDAARMYEAYKSSLRHELDLYGEKMGRQCFLLDLCKHSGFAFGVKHGILYAKERFSSKFALILQHDRCFTDSSGVSTDCLLQSFADNPFIRYMGYPTKASIHYMQYQQDTFRSVWAGVQERLSVAVKIPTDCEGLGLLPMMFWYDSNHIVHIDRMLELYTPFISVPIGLHRHIGGKTGLKSMLMRNGDFIEDRLGQHQRNVFSAFADELIATAPAMKTEELHLKQQELDKLVSFFGCYLIVPVCSSGGHTEVGVRDGTEGGSLLGGKEHETSKASSQTMICSRSLVMHLNGRSRPAPLIVSLLDL
jgi:hypothetical protein